MTSVTITMEKNMVLGCRDYRLGEQYEVFGLQTYINKHVGLWVCLRCKPRTYNKREQWVLSWRLLSANVYKSNGRCLKKFKSNNKGNKRGEQ